MMTNRVRLFACWVGLLGLLGVTCALGRAGVARACAPSRWVVEATAAPACVTSSSLGAGRFEIANGCGEDLTFTTDCQACVGPGEVAAGELGLIELPDTNVEERVDVDFMGPTTTGALTFAFDVNRCPSGEGCAVSPAGSRATPPGARGQGSWPFLLLAPLALLLRRVAR